MSLFARLRRSLDGISGGGKRRLEAQVAEEVRDELGFYLEMRTRELVDAGEALVEFRDLLAERKGRGATIWLTSHVMAEVERVADRVGLIRDGLMARELTMSEVEDRATSRIHLTFPGPVGSDAFEGVPHVATAEADGPAVVVTVDGPVADLLTRAGELGATGIETERQDLDDVFLALFDEQGQGR